MYTIHTNKWQKDSTIRPWSPFGELWQTDNEQDAIRQLAYFRFAYPGYVFSLVGSDGYILSTKELAELAQYIILD